MITEETRRESNEITDKAKRRREIIEVLEEYPDGLTAKECAVKLWRKHLIPTSERNFTAPRLHELVEQGLIEVIGKKKCKYTDRTVAVYSIKLSFNG